MNKAALLKNEKGSTLIEFTAVLSILLLLTFGMIDFGRYIYTISAVHSAAQEGARSALSPEISLVEAQATAESKMVALDLSLAHIEIVRGAEIVNAEVTYEFEFITPLVIAIVPNSTVVVSGTASMAIY